MAISILTVKNSKISKKKLNYEAILFTVIECVTRLLGSIQLHDKTNKTTQIKHLTLQ